jgi:glycosyltransferase involved in cell wall biosynthesis
VTDSPDTADHLIGQGFPSDRIAVVPPGIDIDTIDATPAGAHYDLLCVGRLLEHKNVNLLIEAVGELRDRGDVRTCAIVGTGPERERLGDLVARLQLENEVTFLGNLEAATEIFALMKSASLLVLPSTREGFGMVVVEAMACGTPVITTNHPDNKARNLIDEGVNGWQCDPTTSALVQALIHASQAKLLGELLTAEERTGYSWDGRVTTIYNLVTAALSQAPHHV